MSAVLSSEPRAVAFDDALADLRDIVGVAHVKTAADDLTLYRRCTIPWQSRCTAVVTPANADEVRRVVALAARRQLPLWPVSRGRNWGYGSAMACRDGAIILVLERLNAIREVNEELAYAVIEPGVTYRQLNAHLKASGSRLWCDTTDGPPDGSVLGNALERGVGLTPYSDHFGNLCGLEVVLADGSVVHTGGGGPDCKTRHTHKWGTGPYLEGLFSQSNLGVVTKAGIWLMPAPEHVCTFSLALRDEAKLPAAIDAHRELALRGVLKGGNHIINDLAALAVYTESPEEWGKGALSTEALNRLRTKYRVPPWNLIGGLYGSRATVREGCRELRRALGRYGTLTILGDRGIRGVQRWTRFAKWAQTVPGLACTTNFITRRLLGTSLPALEAVPHLHGLIQGVPSDHFVRQAYFKSRKSKPAVAEAVRDRCGLAWVAPIVPMTGRDVAEILRICRPLYASHGFDFCMYFLVHNPRSLIALMSVFYDKCDAEESARARNLHDAIGTATQAAGYQQYRTGAATMDRLLDPTPDYARVVGTIKAALDPAGILASGRYGVDAARAEARR